MSAPAHTPDVVEPGHFHRLGIATAAGGDVAGWLRRVLGARPDVGSSRQALGLAMHGTGEVTSTDSGATTEILWLGDTPIALFTATSGEGPLGRYVARYGTGLHSVAWTVEDLWRTETLLRRRDLRITGTDLLGRHFFVHPSGTAGLLIEWTDTDFTHDPRDGADLGPAPESSIPVSRVAWLTVVLPDAEAGADVLSSQMRTRVVEAGPVPDPSATTTIDLQVHDIVLRLVSPRGDDSPYAEVLARTGARLYATGLEVPDLGKAFGAMEQEGISVVRHDGALAWSDPASTMGLPFEWTGA